jgi:hypothetical protein
VDPRASLDDMEKRKFLTQLGLELQLLSRPACSQSLYQPCYYIHINIKSELNLGNTFFLNLFGGTFGTVAATGLLYQPRMIGNGDCGEKLVE